VERFYLIPETALDGLRRDAKRLYSEQRMSGDDMRNMAQHIDGLCDAAIPELSPHEVAAQQQRPHLDHNDIDRPEVPDE
jgi:hypothetical protein